MKPLETALAGKASNATMMSRKFSAEDATFTTTSVSLGAEQAIRLNSS